MSKSEYGRSFSHYENYYEASTHSSNPERFNYAIVKFFFGGVEPDFDNDMDKFLWKMIRPSIACSRRQANRDQGAPSGNNNNSGGANQYSNGQSTGQSAGQSAGQSTGQTNRNRNGNRNRISELEVESTGADAPAPSEDFLRFQTWIAEHAPEVAKMKQPFSEKEFREIQQSWPAAAVRDVLEAMSNKRTLTKDYVSAYKTCKSWLKRRAERQGGAGSQKDETTTRPKVTRLEDLR